mmetsp:Transcript_36136/g.95017  ORF Transcript_36136/g.95017 Transcript_36136/m.95017 type:complete len:210 (+) Transcript_36136:806-1435(+)
MFDGRVQKIRGMPPFHAPPETKVWYLIEAGWYFSSFARLLTGPRKGDFVEMAVHHVLTGTLILMSYTAGYVRAGVVVMFLHNLFDPLLHIAKLTHYLAWPVVPDAAFAACAITFLVSRIILYPYCLWKAWTGLCPADDRAACADGSWGRTPSELLQIAMLTALLPIHGLWFFMILKVLKRALFDALTDVRSDSEADEDDAQAAGEKKKR